MHPLHLGVQHRVEAIGRVGRSAGQLALFADSQDDVAAVPPPPPHRVAWVDLAADPEAWAGQAILVRGTVAAGVLRDGDGHRMTLGDGPWPSKGPVEATAAVSYEPSCACHVLTASEVHPLPVEPLATPDGGQGASWSP